MWRFSPGPDSGPRFRELSVPRDEYPAVYGQLKRYYRQDPAGGEHGAPLPA